MANRHYFNHVTPDGKNFLSMMKDRNIGYAMAGEIIAQNNYPTVQTVEQAYQGYMNSPEHRANIMGPYHHVGTAWVVANNGYAYIAVEFS